jgi:voltage-gated potassium channel
MFFLEVELNGRDTPSVGFFLWSERIIAIVFTVEYAIRWYFNKKYPLTVDGIIDLIGFFPFWIGFFVPLDQLKWIRTLRVLRLLKFHRYNEAAKHLCRAVKLVRQELNLLGFASILIIVFSAIAMYEVEHDAKDTKFTKLSDGLWWSVVTLTTIGYGDVYPVTSLGRGIATLTILFGVGIFGTFISLMGSGLVQVYREDRIANEKISNIPKKNSFSLPEDRISS